MAATEFRCRVRSFRMLTPTVFELTFEAEKTKLGEGEQPDFGFEGGQFVSVIVPGAGPNGRDLRRAYSIASSPETRPVELCIKLVEGGPGTNYLYKLRPGDAFRGVAPYGDFTYVTRAGRNACFVATGTGIAPFRSMIFSKEYSDQPPAHTWCLMGVRSEDEIVYEKEITAVPNLTWLSAITQPRGEFEGYAGRVTAWLRSQGDAFPWADTDFYLCGNGAMIKEMKELLTEKGVTKDAIHQEKYY